MMRLMTILSMRMVMVNDDEVNDDTINDDDEVGCRICAYNPTFSFTCLGNVSQIIYLCHFRLHQASGVRNRYYQYYYYYL